MPAQMPQSMLQMPPMYLQEPNPHDALDYNAGALTKKANIRQKLEQAIAKGEMPPYCSNCGAIETPTWRKAWSQQLEGVPGYHEYSDEAGKVTCITILARDAEGKPTSYQLIKKSLGKDEIADDYKEFLLCNRKCEGSNWLNDTDYCSLWNMDV
jgi:hypothetical protein